jgi:hypothetical protein
MRLPNKLPQFVKLTDEANAALRRKQITGKRLVKFLISNDEKDMPLSHEVRQMAALLLNERGFILESPKDRNRL